MKSQTPRSAGPVARVFRAFALATLCAGFGASARAVPTEVTGVSFSSSARLIWSPKSNIAAYNVYSGTVSSLRLGSGECFRGSVETNGVDVSQRPPAGSAFFYLVSAWDGSGEGTLGHSSAGLERVPTLRCVPARRLVPLTLNGAATDGVVDGGEARVNPHVLVWNAAHDLVGLNTATGELSDVATDMMVSGRGLDWALTRTYRSEISYDGPLGSGWDFVDNLHLQRVGGDTLFHSGAGFSERFTGSPGGGWSAPPGLYGALITNADGSLTLRYTDASQRDRRAAFKADVGTLRSGISSFAAGRLPYGIDVGEDAPPTTVTVSNEGRDRLRIEPTAQTTGRGVPTSKFVPVTWGAGGGDTWSTSSKPLPRTEVAKKMWAYSRMLSASPPATVLVNFSSGGRLESVEDERGNRIRYLYDHQNLLTQVVDTLGRTMTYTYTSDGHIATISDPTARLVVYEYQSDGSVSRLVSVRSPIVTGTPNGNDFPSGKITSYRYSDGFSNSRLNGNLLSIVTPEQHGSGVETVQASYGTPGSFGADRVLSLTIGGTNASGVPAGGGMKLIWSALNPGAGSSPPDLPRRRLVLVDRAGNEKTYIHNAAGQLLSFSESSVGGGPVATKQFSYNTDGELLQVVYPLGNRVTFTYDGAGADRFRLGNLVEVRETADSLLTGGRGDGRGGEANDRVWTYTYEPVFNQLASSTGPKGNDPSYLPPNGGSWSSLRYRWRWTYDYQEGNPATNGIGLLASRFGIDLSGVALALGDVNRDGRDDVAVGNPVLEEAPAVQLDAASHQAGIEGDTSQEIETLWRWDGFGQLSGVTDPAGNTSEVSYYPEIDADGDGIATPPPPDGRVLSGTGGGLVHFTLMDTTSDPSRDNGGNPPPQNLRVDFGYDAVGRPTDIIDGRGVRTRVLYNALDQVVESRPAAATSATAGPFGDPPTGRGESDLAPIATRTRWSYDGDDRVVKIAQADPEGARGVGAFVEHLSTYDLLGNPLNQTDPVTASTSRTTTYAYDANENLVSTIWPAGNADHMTYDGRDLVVTATRGASGPLGGDPSTVTYVYDLNGNRITLHDPTSGTIDVVLDGQDRPVRQIDQTGSTIDWYRDPDDDGDRIVKRGPVGGPPPADRSGATNVDLADVRYLRDELGRVFRYNRPMFVSVLNTQRPVSLTEGPLLPGDGSVNHAFEYDELSRLTFETSDSGVVTRGDYDGADRLMSAFVVGNDAPQVLSFAYDAGDNLIESISTERSSSSGPPQEAFRRIRNVDAGNRLLETSDDLGETERYVWSALGDLLVTTDPNGPPSGPFSGRRFGSLGGPVPNGHGNVTRLAYDGMGRPVQSTVVLTATGKGDGTTQPPPDLTNPYNPDGAITSILEWTANGRVARRIDDRGNETTWLYDNLDRTVGVTADDGTFSTIAYDGKDNPVTVTDANGSVATSSYDPAGRLLQMSISRAPGVEGTTLQVFEHDGLGRMTRASDNNDPLEPLDDSTVRIVRDSLGRVVEELQRLGPAGTTVSIDAAWSSEDLLTRLTYPSGRTVDYAYDPYDRLHLVLDGGSTHHVQIETFGQSRWHTRVFDNGLRTTMLDDSGGADIGYDAVQRTVMMRHLDPGNGVVAGFSYSYDRAGNRLLERRLHQPTGPATFRGSLQAHDSSDRLRSIVEGSLTSDGVLVGPPADDQSFTLDGESNWPLMSRHGVTFQATPNNNNDYDEPQSGGAHTDDGVPDDFLDPVGAPADGQNLVHDKNGNQTDTGPVELRYDFWNRPVRAVRSSNAATIGRYAHDALGRFVWRQIEGPFGGPPVQRRYLLTTFLDAEPLDEMNSVSIEERDENNAVTRAVIFGGGVPTWQVRAGGAMDVLLTDEMGSVVALLDASSAALVPEERVAYDAYGKPTFQTSDGIPKLDSTGRFASTSDFGNTTLWRGMRYDEELGARTNDVTTDLGGFYQGGGSAGGGYYNPNQGRATAGRDNHLQGGVDVIQALRRGVVSGCGGGNYCPAQAVTRGVVTGCGGGTYCPTTPVGRRGVVSGCGGGNYCPTDASSKRGVVSGCGGGNYCPTGYTKRGYGVNTRSDTFLSVDRARRGVVSGCGGGNYCPSPTMARGITGGVSSTIYVPPASRRGVVSGCGGGNYCPSGAADRGVSGGVGAVVNPGPGGSERRGVVSGCGGGNYCPTDAVGRGISGGLGAIVDSPPAGAARRGVVSGCGGGNYCPCTATTRALEANDPGAPAGRFVETLFHRGITDSCR